MLYVLYKNESWKNKRFIQQAQKRKIPFETLSFYISTDYLQQIRDVILRIWMNGNFSEWKKKMENSIFFSPHQKKQVSKSTEY